MSCAVTVVDEYLVALVLYIFEDYDSMNESMATGRIELGVKDRKLLECWVEGEPVRCGPCD